MALNVPALARGYQPSTPRVMVKHEQAPLASSEADLFAAQQEGQQSQEFGQAGATLSAVGNELANIAAKRIRQDEYLYANKTDVDFDKAANDHLLAFSQNVTGENTDQQLSDLQTKLDQAKSDLLTKAPTADAQQYTSLMLDKSTNSIMTRAKVQAWKVRQQYGLDVAEQQDQKAKGQAQRARTPEDLQAAMGEIDKNWAGAAASGFVAPDVAQKNATSSKQDALELNVTSQLTDPSTRPWMIKAWEAGDFVGKFDTERLKRLSHQVLAAKSAMTMDEAMAQADAEKQLAGIQDNNFYQFYSKLGTGTFAQSDVSQAVDRGILRPEQGRTLLDKINGAEKKFTPDKNTQIYLMQKYAGGDLSDQDVISAFADGRIDESEAKYWMGKNRSDENPQIKDAKSKLKGLLLTAKSGSMAYDQQLQEFNTATTEVDDLVQNGLKPRDAALEVAKRHIQAPPAIDDAISGYFGGQAPDNIDVINGAYSKMIEDYRAGKIDRQTVITLSTSFKDAQEALAAKMRRMQDAQRMFGLNLGKQGGQ